MGHEFLFLAPFVFFGLIAFISGMWINIIVTTEYCDDGLVFGAKKLKVLSDFIKYTKTLDDKRKIRKHKFLLYSFFISIAGILIWTFLSQIEIVFDVF